MGRPLSGVADLAARIPRITDHDGFSHLDRWNGEVAGWTDHAIMLDLDPARPSRVWLPLDQCRRDGDALYVATWLLRRRERMISDHQAAVTAMRRRDPARGA